MKITFLDPPCWKGTKNLERIFGCTYSLYPMPNIFFLYCAAVLEKEGHIVRYIDAQNAHWRESDFSRFLKADDSDLYCIHTVNLSRESDIQAHTEIRKVRKDVFIVFTGPAATLSPFEYLFDKKTFVVRGEIEVSLNELANTIQCKGDLSLVLGISYIDGKSPRDNPPRPLIKDLSSIPHPARHIIDRSLYYNPKLPGLQFTNILTSRNCPYRCIYCVPNSHAFAIELEYRRFYNNKKPPVRTRSAEDVIAEFKELSKAGYKKISVIDDQFLWSKDRTIKICKGIKDLPIEWGCLGRADHIARSEEVVKVMAESNCKYVDIGIESFDQKILDYIKKDLNVKTIFKAIRLLKKYRIGVKLNMLLGSSPLETKDSINRNIRIAKGLRPDSIMFSIATPFPGTEFYKLAKANEWFVKGDYYPESVQNKAITSFPKLTNLTLERMLRRANLSFFFSLHFIIKNLWRLRSPRELFGAILALKRKLAW